MIVGDQHVNFHMEWLRRLAADPRITPFAVRVAVGMTRYFSRETGDAFPGQVTIAAGAAGKPAGARTALRNLEQAGYLTIERRGRRATNLYRPSFPAGGDGCGDNAHQESDGCGRNAHQGGDGCSDNTHRDGDGCGDSTHLDGDRCGHNGVSVVATTPNPLSLTHRKEDARNRKDFSAANAVGIDPAGLGGEVRTACAARKFPTKADAVEAIADVGLLANDVVALLKGCDFQPERQLLVCRSATAYITLQASAGDAISGLGLRLVRGGVQ